jgi:hypothetical protein
MGITPITNLTPLPVTRAVEKGLEPAPMGKVENTARSGDETYSPSKQKPGRGAEGDSSEEEITEEEISEDEFQNLAGEVEAQPSAQPDTEPATRRISFLA